MIDDRKCGIVVQSQPGRRQFERSTGVSCIVFVVFRPRKSRELGFPTPKYNFNLGYGGLHSNAPIRSSMIPDPIQRSVKCQSNDDHVAQSNRNTMKSYRSNPMNRRYTPFSFIIYMPRYLLVTDGSSQRRTSESSSLRGPSVVRKQSSLKYKVSDTATFQHSTLSFELSRQIEPRICRDSK